MSGGETREVDMTFQNVRLVMTREVSLSSNVRMTLTPFKKRAFAAYSLRILSARRTGSSELNFVVGVQRACRSSLSDEVS